MHILLNDDFYDRGFLELHYLQCTIFPEIWQSKRIILNSAIEILVFCASRGHRGPYGRSEQETLSFGWSPLCAQGPRRRTVRT